MSTPWEDWLVVNRNNMSPDIYQKYAFYFMIGAALQRRVWVNNEERPLFPNMFGFLVGPAALGKGGILKPVQDLLGFHRLTDKAKVFDEQRVKADAIQLLKSPEFYTPQILAKSGQPLFALAPSSTSFEDLVEKLFLTIRTYTNTDETGKSTVYTYRPWVFLLEELNSLFKKGYSNVNNLLLCLYDNSPYLHSTKTGGETFLKNTCVSMLAGCVPKFIEECMGNSMLSDGLASRTFIVYASENKGLIFEPPATTPDQIEARYNILCWLKKLYDVFGRCTYTPKARELGQFYVEKSIKAPGNPAKCLQPFYGRMSAHLPKLCMAVHFSRSLNYVITERDVEDAWSLIQELEVQMDVPLRTLGMSREAVLAERIVSWLEKRPERTKEEIIVEHIQYAKPIEIYEAITYLLTISKQVVCKTLNKTAVYSKVNGSNIIKLPDPPREATDSRPVSNLI